MFLPTRPPVLTSTSYCNPTSETYRKRLHCIRQMTLACVLNNLVVPLCPLCLLSSLSFVRLVCFVPLVHLVCLLSLVLFVFAFRLSSRLLMAIHKPKIFKILMSHCCVPTLTYILAEPELSLNSPDSLLAIHLGLNHRCASGRTSG